jgi:hypothetical protein
MQKLSRGRSRKRFAAYLKGRGISHRARQPHGSRVSLNYLKRGYRLHQALVKALFKLVVKQNFVVLHGFPSDACLTP